MTEDTIKRRARGLDRAFDILDFLKEIGQPLRPNDIANGIGSPKSTVYELVASLLERRILEPVGKDGHVYLGRQLYFLGQAHLRGFVGLADDCLQGVIGLASQVEMTQVCLSKKIQLTTEIDMTFLTYRLQNPSFQQGRDQFVDRGLRTAYTAGDIVRTQGLADFLEEIEDIERPIQTASPALDGVFGHFSGFPF